MDGTILKFGELRESAAMIDQVKGFSYPATSLLGASPFLLEDGCKDVVDMEYHEARSTVDDSGRRSWWRISFASPKVRLPKTAWYFLFFLPSGSDLYLEAFLK